MSVEPVFAYDTTEIVKILDEIEPAFSEEPWRFGRTVDMIEIRRQPGTTPRDILHQLAAVATRHHSAYPQLVEAVDAFCEHMQARAGRVFLFRLRPGEMIPDRVEEGIYFNSVERFWLPIVADGLSVYFDALYPLESGMVYAIDMHSRHSVENTSDRDAVVLAIDIFPEMGELRAG